MAKSNTQMSVEKISLTMAQAVVKYLSVQFSERDSNRQRLIPAVFGIFGHGNVAGLGQALYEYGDDLPYYQTRNEQSMVHTAIGFAKANHRLATLACTSSIGPGQPTCSLEQQPRLTVCLYCYYRPTTMQPGIRDLFYSNWNTRFRLTSV